MKGSPFLEHSHYKNLFQFTDTYKDIFDPMGWTIALELAFYVALAIPCGYYFYVVTGPLQIEKFELTKDISKLQQKYDYINLEVQMIDAYSALDVSTIEQIGSIFLPSKLSETLVTDDEILQTYERY